MHISFIALNRMVENKAAEDEVYRQLLEQRAGPVLSDGRRMSDDELLLKLHSLRFSVDRERLLEIFSRFVSAQDMSEALIRDHDFDIPDSETNWVWIALTCLWERWLPELPNMEMVDDKMQAGYAMLEEEGCERACRLWIETWHDILHIMDRHQIPSLDEFDQWFAGTQSVFNWVQDFEMELGNAGIEDGHFLDEKISLCKTMIGRFSDGALSIENFKSALANSYFSVGEPEKGEQLFDQWLDEDPQWGWGWIAWSDCYFCFAPPENKNAEKAEQILKDGLAVANVSDRKHLLERLSGLYEETGREDEAAAIDDEIKQLRRAKRTAKTTFESDHLQTKVTLDFGEEGLPLDQFADVAQSMRSDSPFPVDEKPRTGRNDPCPCGSGKKFKKCCGKRRDRNDDPLLPR